MKGLIDTLLAAPDDRPLFLRDGAWINAGEVRAMAASAASRIDDGRAPVFLHTRSAARAAAGILAAAARRRTIALPAHVQPAYLVEIGCADGAIVDDDFIAASNGDAALSDADRDPLMVFFTSGSMGAPKPVEKNLSRLETEVRALEKLWGRQCGHVLGTVSHQHIYGLLYRFMWPLVFGRTADDEGAPYWENIEDRLAGATLISSPAHLSRLPPRPLARPALIFSSGQALAAEDAARCIEAFATPAIEVLGSTETGGIAWRAQAAPQTPWTPFERIEVRERDGALCVRSPYLQIDEAYETGDTIALLPDGRFHLKPRGDRVAKIDGKRVSLTRVEEMLSALAEIDAVAALTLEARKGALGAVAALSETGRALLEKEGAFRLSRRLRRDAAQTLEPIERPKHWRFVETMPTDSQGKRVLSTLRALFGDNDPLDALELDIRMLTDCEAEIAFTLAPELVFFEGHFAEHPILPGVAQAHMAVLIAHKLWGSWPPDANMARLKFRRVLVPSDRITLELKRNARTGGLAFAYRLGDDDITTGEIGGVAK